MSAFKIRRFMPRHPAVRALVQQIHDQLSLRQATRDDLIGLFGSMLPLVPGAFIPRATSAAAADSAIHYGLVLLAIAAQLRVRRSVPETKPSRASALRASVASRSGPICSALIVSGVRRYRIANVVH